MSTTKSAFRRWKEAVDEKKKMMDELNFKEPQNFFENLNIVENRSYIKDPLERFVKRHLDHQHYYDFLFQDEGWEPGDYRADIFHRLYCNNIAPKDYGEEDTCTYKCIFYGTLTPHTKHIESDISCITIPNGQMIYISDYFSARDASTLNLTGIKGIVSIGDTIWEDVMAHETNGFAKVHPIEIEDDRNSHMCIHFSDTHKFIKGILEQGHPGACTVFCRNQ